MEIADHFPKKEVSRPAHPANPIRHPCCTGIWNFFAPIRNARIISFFDGVLELKLVSIFILRALVFHERIYMHIYDYRFEQLLVNRNVFCNNILSFFLGKHILLKYKGLTKTSQTKEENLLTLHRAIALCIFWTYENRTSWVKRHSFSHAVPNKLKLSVSLPNDILTSWLCSWLYAWVKNSSVK